MKKGGRQLSMFTDKEVRRSFIHRFTRNPPKRIIQLLRMENLFGFRVIITNDNQSITNISANRHFVNKHAPYVKEGRKFYYDQPTQRHATDDQWTAYMGNYPIL